MIKVKVRYYEHLSEEGFVLGEFPPSEIESVVQLVKKYGVQAYLGNDVSLEADTDTYMDSQWYIDNKNNHFEIIVG